MTSVTDMDSYKSFCKKSCENDEEFKNFKRHPLCIQIYNHVTYEQGWGYIEKINESLLSSIERFKSIDLIGNPAIFNYGVYGKISPTTLRYIKQFSDIFTLINVNFDNAIVCEIGAGFGGLAKIFCDHYKPKKYVIYDLKDVNELIKKHSSIFANTFEVLETVAAEIETDYKKYEYDLVISNYALSECNWTIIEKYFNEVILTSKHGYLTINFTSNVQENISRLLKLFERKSFKISKEEPLTWKDNFIIHW